MVLQYAIFLYIDSDIKTFRCNPIQFPLCRMALFGL